MLELRRRQREVLIEKLPDMANIAAGGLVFGQFLGERPCSLALALFGITCWAAMLGLALFFAKER